jgi:hypothetical protein
LGFDCHPDGGKLIVNEPEAEMVRAIFAWSCRADLAVQRTGDWPRATAPAAPLAPPAPAT